MNANISNATNSEDEDMAWLDLYNTIFAVMLALLAIGGLIGNLCVCIVIARNKSMHTSTNCYLFTLAVCDMVIIACDVKEWIISSIGFQGVLGRPWCLLDLFAGQMAVYCGFVIVTAVSVTRYMVICHPLRPHHLINDIGKTKKLIVVLVVLGFCISLPNIMKYFEYCNTTAVEMVVSESYKLVASLWCLIVYLTMMISVAVLYTLVVLELRRSNRSTWQNPVIDQENRKIIRMLVTMTGVLFICWTPLQIFKPVYQFLSMYTTMPPVELNNLLGFVESPVGFLFYNVSTIVNPICYIVMSEKFREAFKATWGTKSRETTSTKTGTVKTDSEDINSGSKQNVV